MPIQQLPAELLSNILVFSGINTISAFTLASVCTSWRELALRMPALWSNITINNTTSPTMLKEQLARSQDSSISVDCKLHPRPNGTSTMPLVLTALLHISRIRELAILANLDDLDDIFRIIHNQRYNAPVLEKLSIDGTLPCEGEYFSGSFNRLVLHLTSPRLRSLHLTGAPLQADSTVLSSPIRKVHTSMITASTSSWSLYEFCDVLSHTRQIQHLRFNSSMRGHFRQQRPVHRILKLDALQTIYLMDHFNNIIDFFNSVDAPELNSVILIIGDEQPRTDLFLPLKTILSGSPKYILASDTGSSPHIGVRRALFFRRDGVRIEIYANLDDTRRCQAPVLSLSVNGRLHICLASLLVNIGPATMSLDCDMDRKMDGLVGLAKACCDSLRELELVWASEPNADDEESRGAVFESVLHALAFVEDRVFRYPKLEAIVLSDTRALGDKLLSPVAHQITQVEHYKLDYVRSSVSLRTELRILRCNA
jgi:hypothetical protein